MALISRLSSSAQRWQPNDLLDVCEDIEGPRLCISVKLTSLYSQIDPANFTDSVESITSRLKAILKDARKRNVSVCVDMEQYAFKGIVLDCFRSLLMELKLRDWRFIGLAIQAYLMQFPTSRLITENAMQRFYAPRLLDQGLAAAHF